MHKSTFYLLTYLLEERELAPCYSVGNLFVDWATVKQAVVYTICSISA